jgi:hypothetical protein
MTPEQRAEILDIYLTRGFAAAAPIARQFGVHPKAMSKWTRAMGHKGTRGREPGIWKTNVAKRPAKRQVRKYKPAIDHRWAWAIERGEIRI